MRRLRLSRELLFSVFLGPQRICIMPSAGAAEIASLGTTSATAPAAVGVAEGVNATIGVRRIARPGRIGESTENARLHRQKKKLVS